MELLAVFYHTLHTSISSSVYRRLITVHTNSNRHMSFVSLLSVESNDVEFDNENHPNESSINLDPFIQQMSYDNIDITVMNNRQLKTMFNFNTNSQTTNTSNNKCKAFISSPTQHIPRNVWYRFCKKLSTRSNLHRGIPANVERRILSIVQITRNRAACALYLHSKARVMGSNLQEILGKS